MIRALACGLTDALPDEMKGRSRPPVETLPSDRPVSPHGRIVKRDQSIKEQSRRDIVHREEKTIRELRANARQAREARDYEEAERLEYNARVREIASQQFDIESRFGV